MDEREAMIEWRRARAAVERYTAETFPAATEPLGPGPVPFHQLSDEQWNRLVDLRAAEAAAWQRVKDARDG